MNHPVPPNDEQSRRAFLKTAAYAAPLILSLKAEPAFASYGSGNGVGHYGPGKGVKGNNGVGNGWDPQPPGNPPINDGPGSGPRNPGHRHGGGH